MKQQSGRKPQIPAWKVVSPSGDTAVLFARLCPDRLESFDGASIPSEVGPWQLSRTRREGGHLVHAHARVESRRYAIHREAVAPSRTQTSRHRPSLVLSTSDGANKMDYTLVG